MLHHRDAAWEAELPALVDGYLLWKHGSPDIKENDEKFSIAVIGLDGMFNPGVCCIAG